MNGKNEKYYFKNDGSNRDYWIGEFKDGEFYGTGKMFYKDGTYEKSTYNRY